MVSKIASDKVVNEKFVPIGQQINGIVGKAAFYGSSKSALSMTSAIFANHSYILGESDSTFVDGLRARADFIEAAAMSATSTIVNFFYSIGATILAAGAFGGSETMNAAFTRNWMHTKVSFKAAIGSAIGGLTPSGAGYFYKGAATDVAVALRNDITNIIQAAADSKLTDEELTRGLIAYLKTELAGAGQNGLSLAKRIAPNAIGFLTQATEIKIKDKQTQEISDLETAQKKALKGKSKEEKKTLVKEHKAELKKLRESHKLALTQNTNFFNTLSDAFKEDATFKEIGSYVSNTLDGLANERKGEKGAKALEKNIKAKDASYDKMAVIAAKKFLTDKAKNNLRDIENKPVKPASISEDLEIELKEVKKLKGKERKDALSVVNKKIAIEKKQNEKVAEVQQKLKIIEAKAQITIASKYIEILDKYSELQSVKSAHETAQKRLDRISNDKKKYEKEVYKNERKDLKKSINRYSKKEEKIAQAISKIYVKSLKIEEKVINKQFENVDTRCQKLSAQFNKLDTEIYNFPKEDDDGYDANVLAILQTKLRSVENAVEKFNTQRNEFQKRLNRISKAKAVGLSNVDAYVVNFMKNSMNFVSNGLAKAVERTSGDKGVIPTLDNLVRKFFSAWFTRSQPVDSDDDLVNFDESDIGDGINSSHESERNSEEGEESEGDMGFGLFD